MLGWLQSVPTHTDQIERLIEGDLVDMLTATLNITIIKCAIQHNDTQHDGAYAVIHAECEFRYAECGK